MKKMMTAAALLTLVFAMPAFGFADFTWTGNDGPDWDDDGNWAGPNGEFPDDPGDTVTIPGAANAPHVNLDVTVGSVTVEEGGDLSIDSGKTLGIASTDGLLIEDTGELFILGGTLELTGGGKIEFLGNGKIVFKDAPGTIALGGSSPYYIPDGPPPQTGDPRTIFLTHPSQTYAGTFEYVDNEEATPVLCMGRNNAIMGVMNINVRFVNDGWVEANRNGGDIELNDYPKSGEGQWRVCHAGAKIIANTCVTGGECSLVLVTAGILDINQTWSTCGALVMDQSGGKIDVAENVQFKAGTCGGIAGCVE